MIKPASINLDAPAVRVWPAGWAGRPLDQVRFSSEIRQFFMLSKHRKLAGLARRLQLQIETKCRAQASRVGVSGVALQLVGRLAALFTQIIIADL